MNNFQKTITILTAIFSLIATYYGWKNENKITELQTIQEKRESVNFDRDREFKFKIFDYATQSLEKDEKYRSATIDLINNIVEDKKYKQNLIKILIENTKDITIKSNIEKSLTANEYEKIAFRFLLDKKLKEAKENFANSYNSFPTLHNVDEINRLLKSKGANNLDWELLYKEIYPRYQWGMSNEIKNEFVTKTKQPL